MRRHILLTMEISAALLATAAVPATANGGCQDTGARDTTTDEPLTANYVNALPSASLAVTCDVGIYFDVDATIDDVQVVGTVDDARDRQFGIYVDGAHVTLRNATVDTEDAYPDQFVSVAYVSGATGTIIDNEITGAHRAGILLRGAGTDVRVKDNVIAGVGTKSEGWAQNGVQVDTDATATITDNRISDHWWDGGAASSGIYAGSDEAAINRNTLTDNDLGIAIMGDDNNAVHNAITTADTTRSTAHYGIYVVAGENNACARTP